MTATNTNTDTATAITPNILSKSQRASIESTAVQAIPMRACAWSLLRKVSHVEKKVGQMNPAWIFRH